MTIASCVVVLASSDDSVLQRLDKLEARVAQLEAENAELRQRSSVAVSPEGRVLAPEAGRRLAAAQCCRWTPDGTCGEVAAAREYGCSRVHVRAHRPPRSTCTPAHRRHSIRPMSAGVACTETQS